MNDNNRIPIELARQAALFYSRAKWGEVMIDEGTPIVGMADDISRAYVFTVGLKGQVPEPEKVKAHVEKNILRFTKSYKALRELLHSRAARRKAQSEVPKLLVECKEAQHALLNGENFGTIVIGARRNRHPAIIAYEGLPFTLVGQSLIMVLHGESKSLDAQKPVRFCMGDGAGYPHFFGQFSRNKGAKLLVSLLDGYLPSYRNRTPRPPREYKPEDIERYKRIWTLVENISPQYMARISPQYASSGTSGYISGVPDLQWYRGCAPTAAGNILAYWDARGYPQLVDDPPKNEHALIDELADAMDTDSSGSTKDYNVDDGIEAVCNDSQYNNNYAFETDGPDSWYCWGMITDAVNSNRPCHLILHGHEDYGDHSVTVVGYRRVVKDCAADDYFVTIHDTWWTTGFDIEIPYEGSVDGCDVDWQVTQVNPGAGRAYIGCSAKDSTRKATMTDTRVLFTTLASRKAKGPLPEGFRTLYRDAVLTEEFNIIMGMWPKKLEQFGRQLNLAAYLAQAVRKGVADANLVFPHQSASELAEILTSVKRRASPELERSIALMIDGLNDLAGNNTEEIRRKLFGS